MGAFDDFVPQFKTARDRWPDAPTLNTHYNALVECYEGSGYAIIGAAKSFVECVCRTVLAEFGKVEASSDATTTFLLVASLDAVGLKNTRGASQLDKLLSAHNKMADALSQMRNENDPSVHGKDGFLDTLSRNECRAYLVTADAILALLLTAHAGKEPDLTYTREPYDRFEHLHRRIDSATDLDVRVDDDEQGKVLVVTFSTASLPDGIELRLKPSQLAYAVDRSAYVELLSSAIAAPDLAPPQSEVSPPVELGSISIKPPMVATPELVGPYEGPLAPWKDIIGRCLIELNLLRPEIPQFNDSLRDSLLKAIEETISIDWEGRESVQAAIRVALRRVLVRFGISNDRAKQAAEQMLRWLQIELSDDKEAPEQPPEDLEEFPSSMVQ